MKNIDVNKATNKGSTSLYFASKKGHKDIVELLLNQETIDKEVFKLTTSKLLKV